MDRVRIIPGTTPPSQRIAVLQKDSVYFRVPGRRNILQGARVSRRGSVVNPRIAPVRRGAHKLGREGFIHVKTTGQNHIDVGLRDRAMPRGESRCIGKIHPQRVFRDFLPMPAADARMLQARPRIACLSLVEQGQIGRGDRYENPVRHRFFSTNDAQIRRSGRRIDEVPSPLESLDSDGNRRARATGSGPALGVDQAAVTEQVLDGHFPFQFRVGLDRGCWASRPFRAL